MAHEPRRLEDPITLFDAEVFNGGAETANSDAQKTSNYRKFALFVEIAATGSYVDEKLTFRIQFSPDGGTTWHTLQNDPFASYMFTLDQGTIEEVIVGPVAGEDMRLQIEGEGTDASNYFTVTVKLALYSW